MTDIATTETARARRERIRLGMHSFIATRKDIADAYRERDWETLGHDSWESYIEAEFSESRLRLTTDERREAVAELRLAGLSQRAIGAALNVPKSTVDRDLATAPPGAVGVTGVNGKSYAATRPTPQTPGPVDKPPPVDPGTTPAEPVVPSPQAAVAAALDKHVPDPGAAERAWRSDFYALLKSPHELLMRLNVTQIAQHADDQDMETLRLLAQGYADLHRRVLAARGGNVRQLRSVQ